MTKIKMTLHDEQLLANKIIDLEKSLESILLTISDFSELVTELSLRPRKHNADRIQNFIECVDLLKERSQVNTNMKPLARKASRLQSQADDLRWELAMSAEHIAKIESNKMSGRSMHSEDLLQEGYIGLLEAAKRYDPEREIRFTTYARWWVRAQITRCIENTGRLIRIPGGAIEQTRNLLTVMEQYINEGKEYNLEEIANGLGMSFKRANMLLKQQSAISLDSEDPEGNALMDTIPSDVDIAENELQQSEALNIIQTKFTDFLDSREQYILIHHFGLDGNPKQTMREIGEHISLSKERVRQIECKAIERLRHLFH
jgi:RNA polymerase sigma factor (sigma-70 family)